MASGGSAQSADTAATAGGTGKWRASLIYDGGGSRLAFGFARKTA